MSSMKTLVLSISLLVLLLVGSVFAIKYFNSSPSIPSSTVDGKDVPIEVQQKFNEIARAAELKKDASAPVKPKPPVTEEVKDFRSTLSDLAWGRRKMPVEAQKQPSQAQPVTDPQMEMLRARTEYCLRNRDKDPSCR